MGKKGKWLTSVKKAFRSPIKDSDDEEPEVKDLDLFGDIRPLAVLDKQEKPKQKGRRWSFGKLVPAEEKVPEKTRTDGNLREPVLLDSKFAMYMYPSQEEWAAVVIQTAFRGYLARTSLRDLKGLVRLQEFVRGHSVMRQANTTLRSMQALAHVQGRIRAYRVRMSEEGLAAEHQMWQRGQPASRKASDGMTAGRWNDSNLSAQQIETKVQEKQVAALKRERALAYARTQQLRRSSPKPVMPLFIECEVEKAHWGWSYMERWAAAQPWESRIFENQSSPKDVPDGHVSKSVDVSVTRNAKDTSSNPKHQGITANGRRASMGATASAQARASGEFVNMHLKANGGGGGPRSRQSRAASPRSRCSDGAEETGSVAGSNSAMARTTSSILTDPQFGTRYSNSGPVRNGVIVDPEAKSPPVVTGHLQATQSVKNKARSVSQPRTRPGGSAPGAFKTPATMKRLSYAKSEHGHGATAPAPAPATAKADEDGTVANPRISGQVGRPAQKGARPKSGVLPGPQQYNNL